MTDMAVCLAFCCIVVLCVLANIELFYPCFSLFFFFLTLVLPQLCVMSSLVLWARRPLPASLVWPAQDGGTVLGWLFPVLPSLF